MQIDKKSILNASYITLLAILLGSTIALGALVAPVIFKANLFFSNTFIDQYESGRLMSEIFRRYSYLLIVSIAAITTFEAYKMVVKDRALFITLFSAMTIISGSLFAFYYTPEILKMVNLGIEAMDSEHFQQIHIESEICFKLLSASIAMTIFLQVLKKERD